MKANKKLCYYCAPYPDEWGRDCYYCDEIDDSGNCYTCGENKIMCAMYKGCKDNSLPKLAVSIEKLSLYFQSQTNYEDYIEVGTMYPNFRDTMLQFMKDIEEFISNE